MPSLVTLLSMWPSCCENLLANDGAVRFWNTLSNIPFIFLGLHGAFRCLSMDLPHATRFALMHGSIAVIGVGSLVFHSTLKWHAQV